MKIQLGSQQRPVGKIFFLNWKNIFSQLDNYFFPVGQFWTPFSVRFSSFLPLFLLILEVRQKYADLKNIYNWQSSVVYTIIETCKVRMLLKQGKHAVWHISACFSKQCSSFFYQFIVSGNRPLQTRDLPDIFRFFGVIEDFL